MTRSATLARLTLETSNTHRVIDEALLGPLEFLNAAGYRQFLCMLYGFQAPLEAALVMTPGIDLDFVAERAKAGRIATDLLSLGLTRNEFRLLARRQNIGPFTTIGEALGWMYVTERIMLHVEALRGRLESELPVVYALASQFVTTYRHIADVRWRDFGRKLDRTRDADRVVAAATTGLESFRNWMLANGATLQPVPRLLIA
jgi:heme oxygenase